jgi:hypothetical protein
MQVIIYKNDDGSDATVYPTAEGLALFGIEGIAQKDVPAGKEYKIVNLDESSE